MFCQELLYVCQVVSGTLALSLGFLRLADDIAARLVNTGVDINASLPILPRFLPGRVSSTQLSKPCTATDLAFDALVMQAKPCCTLSPDFSLYRRLIAKLGLCLEGSKLEDLALCPAEHFRYKSALLDLMLSPHQLDVCKWLGYLKSDLCADYLASH
jgi:hypothetical protein